MEKKKKRKRSRRSVTLPNDVILPTSDIFLVCEECRKLFTLESCKFAAKIRKGQIKFFCTYKCNCINRKITKDLEYVKNRLINESIKDPKTGCWNWHNKTVGKIRVNRKSMAPYKASYILFNGEILNNLHVRHKCDNPKCVNPEHLELGTNQDNVDDKVKRNRQIKGEQCHAAKLTENDVVEIRRLWSLNDFSRSRPRPYNYAVLGDMFGVRSSTIMMIIKGLGWKHLLPKEVLIKT